MKATISICDFYYYKPTVIYIHVHPNLGQQSICAWLPFVKPEKPREWRGHTRPVFILALETFVDFFQPDACWKLFYGLAPEALLIRINYAKSYISTEYFFQRSINKLIMQETKRKVCANLCLL